MANEILKQLKTKIALKQNTYSYWTEGAGKDYIPLYGEVCFCEIASKDQGAQNAPTVLFKVGTAKLNEDGSYVDGTAKKFAELKWASALAADVYDWAKLSGANVFAKDGDGNVISGIEYDATMNGGKGGFKYTTASVATSEGLSDLQKTVAAIEKEIDDKEASWALNTDTQYAFEIPAEGDHKGKLAVTATTYTNGTAGTPATTYYDFVTPDELSALLAGKVDKTQKINGHALSGDVNLTLGDFAKEDNPSNLSWSGDFDARNVAATKVSAEDFEYKTYGDKIGVSIDEIYATKTELQQAVADHDDAVDTKLESYRTSAAQDLIDAAQNEEIAKKADKATTYTKDETDAKFGNLALGGTSIKVKAGSYSPDSDYEFIRFSNNGQEDPTVYITKDIQVGDILKAPHGKFTTSLSVGGKAVATQEYADGKANEVKTGVENGTIKAADATHADAATKVDAALTVKVGGADVVFDGSEAKTADVDTAITNAIAGKANFADVYTKTEADGKFADAAEYAVTKGLVDNFFSESGAENVMDTLTEIVTYIESDKEGAIQLGLDVEKAKSDAAAAVNTANAANTTAGQANTTAGEAKALAEEAKEAATNATTGAAASAAAAAKSAGEASAAKDAAVAAQGKAEDAQAAAEAAQSEAVIAKGYAVDAQLAAEAAGTEAGNAQRAAETAQSKAEAAQGAAEGSAAAALASQGAAAQSVTDAGAAKDAAVAAQGAAETAQAKAEEAQGKAEDAKGAAESAKGAAEAAQAKAEAAQAAAEASNTSATAIANEAKGLAEGAVSTANTAKSTADTAKATADAALQSIEVGTGLKASAKAENKQTVEIDDEVIFVLNCNF